MIKGSKRSTRFLDFMGLEWNVLIMIMGGSLQAVGTRLWEGYVVRVLDALGAAGWMRGQRLSQMV